MKLTQHALHRSEERGIPPFVVDCVLEFGEVEYDEGREICRFSGKSEKKLKHYLGASYQAVKKVVRPIYVVVREDRRLTVARQTTHLKRNR